MATPFESVARAAIEEILMERMHKTKHGFVITERGYNEVVNEFYRFLQTSRTLKEKGDRLITGGISPTRSRF